MKYLKPIAKVLLGLTALNLCGLGVYHYNKKPLESFCNGIPSAATPEAVMTEARLRGFPARDFLKERNRISVVNHIAPYFRFACTVTFKDGKVESTRVIDAD